MAEDALELRLRFLQKAARSLAVASPTVSATLGAASDSILAASSLDVVMAPKEWNALRRDTCGACGGTMIPGWTCQVAQRTHQPKRSRSLPSEPDSKGKDKQTVYTCWRCDRKTVQTLQSRPPKHVKAREEVSTQKTMSTAPIAEESKVIKSANATSKQRKKARKGGLQAMLDKSKTTQSAGNPLDLMDFLT